MIHRQGTFCCPPVYHKFGSGFDVIGGWSLWVLLSSQRGCWVGTMLSPLNKNNFWTALFGCNCPQLVEKFWSAWDQKKGAIRTCAEPHFWMKRFYCAWIMVKKILILVKTQVPRRVTVDEKDEREGSFGFTGFILKLLSIFSWILYHKLRGQAAPGWPAYRDFRGMPA